MEASIAIFLPKKWKIHKQWVYMEVATFCEGKTQQGKSIKSIDKGKRNDLNKSGLTVNSNMIVLFLHAMYFQNHKITISNEVAANLTKKHYVQVLYIVKGTNTQNNGCF